MDHFHSEKHFPSYTKQPSKDQHCECSLCGDSFEDRNSLLIHLLDENHVKSNLFNPKIALPKNIHIPAKSIVSNSLHEDTSNKCSICTQVFDGSLLDKRKVYHQPKSNFECPFCFKPFQSLMLMLKHKNTHARCHNKFQCFKCRISYSRYEKLLTHFDRSKCLKKHQTTQKVKAIPVQSLRLIYRKAQVKDSNVTNACRYLHLKIFLIFTSKIYIWTVIDMLVHIALNHLRTTNLCLNIDRVIWENIVVLSVGKSFSGTGH